VNGAFFAELVSKQNVQKVWERRSHAFSPHYTPGARIYICLLHLQFTFQNMN